MNANSLIVVNCRPYETRVARVENGLLAEFHVERARDRSYVGNIYKGRVLKVLPGMQAAFVEIGLERSAYLYVADLFADPEAAFGGHEPDPVAEEPVLGVVPAETVRRGSRPTEQKIESVLREGQELVVQVAKDPIGAKGCRITTNLSLAGRHLVFLPGFDRVGISRKIEDPEERQRLRSIVEGLRQGEGGFIVRTASEGLPAADLEADMQLLLSTWALVRRNVAAGRVPGLVHAEMDLVLRAVRDLFTTGVERLVIDAESEYRRVTEFIAEAMPNHPGQVELYQGREPIFDAYNLETDINRALGRKVWLKSGGYIVFDEAEALTAIDVNTGRYVGRRDQEDTVLRTNLEAVKEIAYQLRLRNIGGIIIIDFIDMEKEASREKVHAALKEALRNDRAKTSVLKISELGLIEMTRKRVRQSLNRALCEPCFYCDGDGFLRARSSICHDVLREIDREATRPARGRAVRVRIHPEIHEMLHGEEWPNVAELQKRLDLDLELVCEPAFHLEHFEVGEPDGETRPG